MLGKLIEELSDLVGLLRPGEVKEAVHFVVRDVGQQGFPGGTGIERAPSVRTRHECQGG